MPLPPFLRFDWCAWLWVALAATAAPASSAEPDFQALWEERLQSIVVLDYFVQLEEDREPRSAIGIVVDNAGLLVFLEQAFPAFRPDENYQNIRLYLPGQKTTGNGFSGTYLGTHPVEGWHYVRAEEAMHEHLTAVSDFGMSRPRLGESLWGIGLLPKAFDYRPYLLRSTIGVTQRLPLEHGFTQDVIASTGGLVFDHSGRLVGWAGNALPEEKIMLMRGERFRVGLQDPRDSSVFLFAATFLKEALVGVPGPEGELPRPWVGIAGLQPLEPTVAEFLGLEGQGAVVVSDILKDSAAEQAGLQARDIIVALKGEAIPAFAPQTIAVAHVERTLRGSQIGQPITLSVVRGEAQVALEITPEQAPPTVAEVERKHFAEVGLAVRAFTVYDAVARREMDLDLYGVVTSFVKANSPPFSAGLRRGDWIQEIDGNPVASFNEATRMIEDALADETRRELVLLVNRNNETQVLRVKLP